MVSSTRSLPRHLVPYRFAEFDIRKIPECIENLLHDRERIIAAALPAFD